MILNALIIIGTFFFMEVVAWATHKYVMHGFLWSWHKSHHTMHDHVLERNDLFALVFSIPSFLMIWGGYTFPEVAILRYFGYGVLAYGIFYFLFHDILVHRRIKIKVNPKKGYLKRIMNAHYIHHEKRTKEGCQAFGFLWAPKKFSGSGN